MKALLVSTALLGMTLSGAAFAQTSAASGSQAPSQPNAASGNAMLTANKLVQDLQKSGLTDVKVVAEAFVVQGKTKDGDPVVMTVGPHGMTAFEALPGANTTGSTRPAGSSAANAHPGSTGTSPQK